MTDINDLMVSLSRRFESVPLKMELNGQSLTVPSRAIRYEDTKEYVATVSDKYVLAQNADTIIPAAEKLISEGWQIAKRVGGRQPIRIEGGGRRSYIELIHPKKFDIGLIQRNMPDLMSPRFVLGNSVDGTSCLHGRGGVFVIICTNGMIAGRDAINIGRRRHMGERINNSGDDMLRAAQFMVDNAENLAMQYQQLGTLRPGYERARAAIEAVTMRQADDVEARVEAPLTVATGWQVMNGITNWQTFAYKGSQETLDRSQMKAFELLTSTVPLATVPA